MQLHLWANLFYYIVYTLKRVWALTYTPTHRYRSGSHCQSVVISSLFL